MKENNLERPQIEIENQDLQKPDEESTSEEQEELEKLRGRLTTLLAEKGDVQTLDLLGLTPNLAPEDKLNLLEKEIPYHQEPRIISTVIKNLGLEKDDPGVISVLEQKKISQWIRNLSLNNRPNLQEYLAKYPEEKPEIRRQIVEELLQISPLSAYSKNAQEFFIETGMDPLTDTEIERWANNFLEHNDLNAEQAQWFVSKGVSAQTEKLIVEYLYQRTTLSRFEVIIHCSQVDAADIEEMIAEEISKTDYPSFWQDLLKGQAASRYNKTNILQLLFKTQTRTKPETVSNFFLDFKKEIEKSDPERFKSIKQTVVNNLINSRYQDFSLLDYRIQAITGEEMSEDQIETVLNNLNTITQSTVDFIREHSAKIEDSQIISLADRYLYKAVQGNFKPAYVAELYKIAGQDPKDNEDLLRKMIERLELEKDMP